MKKLSVTPPKGIMSSAQISLWRSELCRQREEEALLHGHSLSRPTLPGPIRQLTMQRKVVSEVHVLSAKHGHFNRSRVILHRKKGDGGEVSVPCGRFVSVFSARGAEKFLFAGRVKGPKLGGVQVLVATDGLLKAEDTVFDFPLAIAPAPDEERLQRLELAVGQVENSYQSALYKELYMASNPVEPGQNFSAENGRRGYEQKVEAVSSDKGKSLQADPKETQMVDSTLTPEQREAFLRALSCEAYLCVAGPGGSGKSLVSGRLAKYWADKGFRVLVVCPEGPGVDEATEAARVAGLGARMALLGVPGPGAEDLKPVAFDRLLKRRLAEGFGRRKGSTSSAEGSDRRGRSSSVMSTDFSFTEVAAIEEVLFSRPVVFASPLEVLDPRVQFFRRRFKNGAMFDVALIDDTALIPDALAWAAALHARRAVFFGDPAELGPSKLFPALLGRVNRPETLAFLSRFISVPRALDAVSTMPRGFSPCRYEENSPSRLIYAVDPPHQLESLDLSRKIKQVDPPRKIDPVEPPRRIETADPPPRKIDPAEPPRRIETANPLHQTKTENPPPRTIDPVEPPRRIDSVLASGLIIVDTSRCLFGESEITSPSPFLIEPPLVNHGEAGLLPHLCKVLIDTFSPSDLFLTSAFETQRTLILQQLLLASRRKTINFVPEVSAPYDLQKGSRKVVVFSAVRSNPARIGADEAEKFANFLLTRSEKLFVLLGDSKTLCANFFFDQIFDFAQKNESLFVPADFVGQSKAGENDGYDALIHFKTGNCRERKHTASTDINSDARDVADQEEDTPSSKVVGRKIQFDRIASSHLREIYKELFLELREEEKQRLNPPRAPSLAKNTVPSGVRAPKLQASAEKRREEVPLPLSCRRFLSHRTQGMDLQEGVSVGNGSKGVIEIEAEVKKKAKTSRVLGPVGRVSGEPKFTRVMSLNELRSLRQSIGVSDAFWRSQFPKRHFKIESTFRITYLPLFRRVRVTSFARPTPVAFQAAHDPLRTTRRWSRFSDRLPIIQ